MMTNDTASETKTIIRTIVKAQLQQAFEKFTTNPGADQWSDLMMLMYVHQCVIKSPSFDAGKFNDSSIATLSADIFKTLGVTL